MKLTHQKKKNETLQKRRLGISDLPEASELKETRVKKEKPKPNLYDLMRNKRQPRDRLLIVPGV